MRFGALLGSRGIASRAGLLRLLMVVALVGAGIGVWRVSTQATASPSIAVNPSYNSQLWWNRTPFPVNIVLTNATNVAGYQFTLRWDPTLIRWVSGTLPTTWLASTGRGPLCALLYDLTPTPTGTPPTASATFTPAAPTATRTPTATPGGNLTWGCASLGNAGQVGLPPGPSVNATPVTLGTFKFKSIADGEADIPLLLSNVAVVNSLSTPAAGVAAVNGSVSLVGCHDLDHDGAVSILDLALVADHFTATITNPLPPGWVWDPEYDVDGDHALSILDLSIIAAGFGLTGC